MINGERGRVLLVDDDAAFRASIAAILEDDFVVVPVGDLASARSALARGSFDVVISDHDLQRGSGVDFLHEVASRYSTIARILLTGRADSGRVRTLAAKSREDGLTLVFYKPVDPADLISWVKNGVAMARLARAKVRYTS